MSASVNSAIVNPDSGNGSTEAIGQAHPARSAAHKNYKGFVAGVFSGITKLSGGSLDEGKAEERLIHAQSVIPSTRSRFAYRPRQSPSSAGQCNV